MPKSRRTRKDKQQADKRKIAFVPQLDMQIKQSAKPLNQSSTEEKPIKQAAPIITSDYKYFSMDLLKTFILTASIVVAEIIIYTYTNIAK